MSWPFKPLPIMLLPSTLMKRWRNRSLPRWEFSLIPYEDEVISYPFSDSYLLLRAHLHAYLYSEAILCPSLHSFTIGSLASSTFPPSYPYWHRMGPPYWQLTLLFAEKGQVVAESHYELQTSHVDPHGQILPTYQVIPNQQDRSVFDGPWSQTIQFLSLLLSRVIPTNDTNCRNTKFVPRGTHLEILL